MQFVGYIGVEVCRHVYIYRALVCTVCMYRRHTDAESLWNNEGHIVVSVSDCHVFNHIHCMEDIASSGWNGDANDSFTLCKDVYILTN